MMKEKPPQEDLEPPGTGPIQHKSSYAQVKTARLGAFRGSQNTTGKIVKIIRAHPFLHHSVSEQAKRFYLKYFPGTSVRDWNDWRWQLLNRITDSVQLAEILNLSREEREAFAGSSQMLPVSITPYYASLLEHDNPNDPLRKAVVPVCLEHNVTPEELGDPLGEHHDSPVSCLVHRYPDRVLFLATNFCSTYCRYCTRSRIVGHSSSTHSARSEWEKAIDYIRRTPAVRDVLISGGDPLTMSNDRLEWLISRLRAIPHVEIIRIGTKTPAVLPQRITPALVNMLKKYHPLMVSIHFTHPAELTPETSEACERLADAGIPLGSQTVLLKGINDDDSLLKTLFQGLLKIRVRPYYLYQCDLVPGTSHFRTPVEKGAALIDQIQGFTTGYAVPRFVVDAPDGGGKIPVSGNRIVAQSGRNVYLKNYEGKIYTYVNP